MLLVKEMGEGERAHTFRISAALLCFLLPPRRHLEGLRAPEVGEGGEPLWLQSGPQELTGASPYQRLPAPPSPPSPLAGD